MKIAVCLPSYNEAQNIQNITRIIDQGLVDFIQDHSSFEAMIVNVDSNSQDGTSKLFLETDTTQPKHSIVIAEAVGKGQNIFEFCSYVLAHSVDLCLTIDTDITSATSDWVGKLLNPLVEQKVAYVAPIYERSRFEGSSTNHFAFPLIYALFGQLVRQPIAGDFAFTRAIAKAINDSDWANTRVIQRYGIDIFMTMTAVGIGKGIAQIDLGRKAHSPSFSKLEYMFPQIAAAAVLSSNNISYSRESPGGPNLKPNIMPDLNFAHKNVAHEMKARAVVTLRELANSDWINTKMISSFIEAAMGDVPEETKMTFAWTDVMANWIKHFCETSTDVSEAERAGNELLPFFVIRATNFWFWAETVSVAEVENAIRKQAELLKDKVSLS